MMMMNHDDDDAEDFLTPTSKFSTPSYHCSSPLSSPSSGSLQENYLQERPGKQWVTILTHHAEHGAHQLNNLKLLPFV
eukprot:9563409-Karenia_brevis.AAC.1